jgi:hypothetical protein
MQPPDSDHRAPQVVEIVRQKAEHLRRERGQGADKPCVRCVHYEPGNWGWLLSFTVRCSHPVFSEYEVNRVSGELAARSRTTPAQARTAGSLCGPDAFLFEEKSKWRRFKKWLAGKFDGTGDDDPPHRLEPPGDSAGAIR